MCELCVVCERPADENFYHLSGLTDGVRIYKQLLDLMECSSHCLGHGKWWYHSVNRYESSEIYCWLYPLTSLMRQPYIIDCYCNSSMHNLRKWGSTKQLSLAEAWCHCFTSDIWFFCAHCSMCACFVFPSMCEGAVCLVQWREPAFGIPRFARVSGLDGDALHCLDLWAPQHMCVESYQPLTQICCVC